MKEGIKKEDWQRVYENRVGIFKAETSAEAVLDLLETIDKQIRELREKAVAVAHSCGFDAPSIERMGLDVPKEIFGEGPYLREKAVFACGCEFGPQDLEPGEELRVKTIETDCPICSEAMMGKKAA